MYLQPEHVCQLLLLGNGWYTAGFGTKIVLVYDRARQLGLRVAVALLHIIVCGYLNGNSNEGYDQRWNRGTDFG